MAPDWDDSALVTASLGGEARAFASLVERYQEVAFRAAYLITRDAGAAEEVAQDGFVRAHRSLATYRREEPFRPWLLRIVTNLALNQVRGAGRRRRLAERFGFQRRPETEPAAEHAALLDERQRQLWAAIRTLPEDDRVVLYLRYFLELPEREIAAVIGKAPGTVKSRLSRAGGRLRGVIERDFPALLPGGGGGND